MELSKKDIITYNLNESIRAKKAILEDEQMMQTIEDLSSAISLTISHGGKILICGNGGSASDSLHMAGEIVGRFQKERSGWPAVALNADVATMTAIANDYGYDRVFERQTEALMTSKDLLIGISTSGNSENVYKAILKAQEIGGKTAALTGKDGGKIAKVADYSLVARSHVTARVQESHITIIHILCELMENDLAKAD